MKGFFSEDAAQVQQRLGRVELPQAHDLQVAERAGGPEDAANDATDAEEDDATLHVAREFIMYELLRLRADVHEDRHRDAVVGHHVRVNRRPKGWARSGACGRECWSARRDSLHARAGESHRAARRVRGAAWTARLRRSDECVGAGHRARARAFLR